MQHLVYVINEQELAGHDVKDRHIIKPLKEAITNINEKLTSFSAAYEAKTYASDDLLKEQVKEMKEMIKVQDDKTQAINKAQDEKI